MTIFWCVPTHFLLALNPCLLGRHHISSATRTKSQCNLSHHFHRTSKSRTTALQGKRKNRTWASTSYR